MRKSKVSLVVATLIGSTLAATAAVSVASEPAGYRITSVGEVTGAIHTSPRAINNSGQVAGQLADLRGQNIRFDLLDPEDFPSVEDILNPTERQHRAIRDFLTFSVGVDAKFQHLATELGYFFDGANIAELDGFEAIDEETGMRSDSVSFRVIDMNNHGVVVGQASEPFYWIEDTDNEGELARFHIRDGFPRAAWSDGVNYTLVPGDESLIGNGTSSIMAINDENVAVGFAAIANGSALTTFFENVCTSEEDEDEEGNPINLNPISACLHRYWFERSGLAGTSAPLMEEEAYRWVFDDQGNVIEQARLGLAFDKDADAEDDLDTFRYRSVANDINIHGIAVGVSQRQVAGGTFTRPTLFTEDGAVEMLPGNNSSNNSLAIAINDANIAVGFSNQFINGAMRRRLFYMDVTNGVSEPEYPRGFFNDSSWQPRGINNVGQIVGAGQNDATQGGQRRSTAFLYDINTDVIVDLNTYLPCNSEYQIIDAIDINDAGEIAVLAVEIADFIEDGETQEVARLRSLILTPDSAAERCQQEDDQLTRKGAAMHPIWLGVLTLVAVISIRRRKPKA
ncbi:MAG: DUF3466 family protein [Idiomarina sp.]|nr:DUF3466 family protein [Idiomarina sp.]